MAVDADAIARADLRIPDPKHPFLNADGTVDRVWFVYLNNLTNTINELKTLANAIKTEVDTQHP